MPLVRIEIVKRRSLEDRRRLFQAGHDAPLEAIQIPDDEQTARRTARFAEKTARMSRNS